VGLRSSHFSHRLSSASEHGSALLFALFVCLGAGLLVLSLSALGLCVERALSEEASGRELVAGSDAMLSALVDSASRGWSVATLPPHSGWAGSLHEVATSGGWLLEASAAPAPGSPGRDVSGLVERARDGLDLPLAAVVAQRISGAAGRLSPAVESEALLYLVESPPSILVGAGCTLHPLAEQWTLDQGWAAAASALTSAGGHAAAGETVCFAGNPGEMVPVPAGACADLRAPGLILLTGGADLDIRGRGDLYGVIVVDGGSVRAEGTVIHGAVICSGCLYLGATGAVEFDRAAVRKAAERSFRRVRLVPGSRREAVG
jgi:hypothetical protein